MEVLQTVFFLDAARPADSGDTAAGGHSCSVSLSSRTEWPGQQDQPQKQSFSRKGTPTTGHCETLRTHSVVTCVEKLPAWRENQNGASIGQTDDDQTGDTLQHVSCVRKKPHNLQFFAKRR